MVFQLDDQNEIKDFEVLHVKVRDGYEEYSDEDTDSDDWRLMVNCEGSVYITSQDYGSYKRYETHQVQGP